jgi:hypothetical protein
MLTFASPPPVQLCCWTDSSVVNPRCILVILAFWSPLFTFRIRCSDDHLRNTLSTQRLAALECLTLQASQGVENRSNHKDHGSSDQAGRLGPDADPLYGAHNKVYGGAHIVGAEFADERVELGRRWADAEEERYFDEDDDKGAYSVEAISDYSGHRNERLGITYKQTMLNATTKVGWKMFETPSAKHRNIHSTPVLVLESACVARECCEHLFVDACRGM